MTLKGKKATFHRSPGSIDDSRTAQRYRNDKQQPQDGNPQYDSACAAAGMAETIQKMSEIPIDLRSGLGDDLFSAC
jgi:hypothetical protein